MNSSSLPTQTWDSLTWLYILKCVFIQGISPFCFQPSIPYSSQLRWFFQVGISMATTLCCVFNTKKTLRILPVKAQQEDLCWEGSAGQRHRQELLLQLCLWRRDGRAPSRWFQLMVLISSSSSGFSPPSSIFPLGNCYKSPQILAKDWFWIWN